MNELYDHYKNMKKISVITIIAHSVLLFLSTMLFFIGGYSNIYFGIFLIIFNSLMTYFAYKDYLRMKKKQEDLVSEALKT